MSSNPAAAVAPFGKALYPQWQVFRRNPKPTSFLAKRAGRSPGEVVRKPNIRKRVNNVDPWWFTLEGNITVCSLRTTSTRHLNVPCERRRLLHLHNIQFRGDKFYIGTLRGEYGDFFFIFLTFGPLPLPSEKWINAPVCPLLNQTRLPKSQIIKCLFSFW